MSYRDDRDALHARNQALEDELAAARQREEHAARTHEDELTAALQGQRPIRVVLPERHQRIHAGAAAAMIGASVLAFTAVLGLRATRTYSGCPHSAANAVVATWDARVITAAGAAVEPGDACTITSTMRFSAGKPVPDAPRVDCGPLSHLYDSAAPSKMANVTHPSSSVEQHVVDGALALDLVYTEQGDAERILPRISIDTARGVATIRRDDPELLVELAVTPHSRPRITHGKW